MTGRGHARVADRISTAVTPLDRRVRKPVLEWLEERVIVLTDGQVEDDASLATALVRAAQGAARSSAASADAGGDAPVAPDVLDAEERAKLARDARRVVADDVDRAMVALGAAERLIRDADGPNRSGTLDHDTLIEIARLIAEEGNHPLLREAALGVLVAVLRRLRPVERAPALGVEGLRRVRAFALGRGASRFVQCRALELLVSVKCDGVDEDLSVVFAECTGPDSMIVRAHATLLTPHSQLSARSRLRLVWSRRRDESEHVRQAVAQALRRIGSPRALELLGRLAVGDRATCVRGRALLELADAAAESDAGGGARCFCRALRAACEAEAGAMQRAALAAMRRVMASPVAGAVVGDVAEGIQRLIDRGPLDIAELAATFAREVSLAAHPSAHGLIMRLSRALSARREGQAAQIRLPEGVSQAQFEQAAFVATCRDLPVALVPRGGGRYDLLRGERRAFRTWRLLYELRHWGPDKRQSFLHTHSRKSLRHATTVPLRQAEVTPTRVPGERRTSIGQSWGCFLPRVDDLLASLQGTEPKRLVTALGTICVRAPRGVWQRMTLRLRVTLDYARLSDLRDQSLGSSAVAEKKAYLNELRRLGFEVDLRETRVAIAGREVSTLPDAAGCFYASALPLSLSLWLEDALQYLVSPSGNTAWHLALVVWTILSLMIARAARVQRRFEAARRAIPLSVGGWGSRGKSGTERLKSALFHSQHLDVVSKTTGCEAMLILARRDEMALELFLYRPYDKATIWEQAAAVEHAQRLGAQVFSWECMALQPEFVDILNSQWMRDPITTITNAYPDHEDVMGPSGEDVARVIGRFVPRGGTVLSSEDQMQAIIRESALARDTQLIDVEELEADLLPSDLLARFPYQEHPRNIALTLRLAEHFGIERTRALVDVADHVVPDLGVLKTFPEIPYRGRTITFSNGMSANERAGFLSNWTRLGFDRHDVDRHPDTWLVAVVNNRADRVPRSRVFANLLAQDVTLDRIVIIGTNVSGMRGFLREALDDELRQLGPPERVDRQSEWFDALARRLGVPLTREGLLGRVVACVETLLVEGVEPSPAARAESLVDALEALASEASAQDLASRLDALLAARAEALAPSLRPETCWRVGKACVPEVQLALRLLVEPWVRISLLRRGCTTPNASPDSSLAAARATYREIFMQKVVVLEDSDAGGDAVLDFTFRSVPPGLRAKVLGCQNIKGTGLDFIYRFMEIQGVADWLRRLEGEPSERSSLLAQMKEKSDYGFFGSQFGIDRLRQCLRDAPTEWQPHVDEVAGVLAHLEQRRRVASTKMASGVKRSRWQLLLGRLEPLVDHLDGIRRRRMAERTMQALVAGEIDTATAAERLRGVVARQKGGWLAKDVLRVVERLGLGRGPREAVILPSASTSLGPGAPSASRHPT